MTVTLEFAAKPNSPKVRDSELRQCRWRQAINLTNSLSDAAAAGRRRACEEAARQVTEIQAFAAHSKFDHYYYIYVAKHEISNGL